MELPPDVHSVSAKGGVTYFYHQERRNTPQAGARTALGKDPSVLWDKWRELNGTPQEREIVVPKTEDRSFREMVLAWRGDEKTKREPSREWKVLAPATQKDYAFYTDKMLDFWGDLPAASITPAGALLFRDTFEGSIGSANHAMTIGKGLYSFGIPRGFALINPFREIKALPTEDEGHWPWPVWARDYVEQSAPVDIRRFVYLATQTGQRESDVVRFGPPHREGRGLWVRPKKTKKKRKALFVALTGTAAATIDRWQKEPMEFTGGRWGKVSRFETTDYYVVSPTGRAYTPEGLRSRWNRWLDKEAGKDFLARWTVYERALRERDGEEIAPDETFKPTLHGLRSTAVVVRRMVGYTHQQISNDIGMSIPMVTKYSRFMDQKEAAENNIVRLEERLTGTGGTP